jgi:hypothetical protein
MTIQSSETCAMTFTHDTLMPRRVADSAPGDTARSSTLESVFRLIAEAIESASAARTRYPLAD